MNTKKRQALKRFKKIKALKKQRRSEAISKFVRNASKEMKIAIAKEILGLKMHETIDDHPIFGIKTAYQVQVQVPTRLPTRSEFEYYYSSPCNKE